MRAVLAIEVHDCVLVMVGNGVLEHEVRTIAAGNPSRFRILPFQNQSRMPIVYRLGQLFVLPSAYGETWGLAVNEAMACGRPVLVSDRVGCAADVVTGDSGRIFPANDPDALRRYLNMMIADPKGLADMGKAAAKRAWAFDLSVTEAKLIEALDHVCKR